jgi:hypothetical protein
MNNLTVHISRILQSRDVRITASAFGDRQSAAGLNPAWRVPGAAGPGHKCQQVFPQTGMSQPPSICSVSMVSLRFLATTKINVHLRPLPGVADEKNLPVGPPINRSQPFNVRPQTRFPSPNSPICIRRVTTGRPPILTTARIPPHFLHYTPRRIPLPGLAHLGTILQPGLSSNIGPGPSSSSKPLESSRRLPKMSFPSQAFAASHPRLLLRWVIK